jgi:hypothetical protein
MFDEDETKITLSLMTLIVDLKYQASSKHIEWI